MRMSFVSGLILALIMSLASFQDAHSESLMQCMEKCIQYEGGNSATNKDTCKSRCGAAMIKSKPGGMRDCMGEFKACKKKCGKEKIIRCDHCKSTTKEYKCNECKFIGP